MRICNANLERAVSVRQVLSSRRQSLEVIEVSAASYSGWVDQWKSPVSVPSMASRCAAFAIWCSLCGYRYMALGWNWCQQLLSSEFISQIKRRNGKHTSEPAGHILPSLLGSDSCILSDSSQSDDCDRRQRSHDP